MLKPVEFQHTAARRRLDLPGCFSYGDTIVSTHSRPKAAGGALVRKLMAIVCFNTQPPEGGWLCRIVAFDVVMTFQHTAARRRLERLPSRCLITACFNTQPPEGGWRYQYRRQGHQGRVSTHSRPKAAGADSISSGRLLFGFQHTAARRRLGLMPLSARPMMWFQHTAARRRLEPLAFIS